MALKWTRCITTSNLRVTWFSSFHCVVIHVMVRSCFWRQSHLSRNGARRLGMRSTVTECLSTSPWLECGLWEPPDDRHEYICAGEVHLYLWLHTHICNTPRAMDNSTPILVILTVELSQRFVEMTPDNHDAWVPLEDVGPPCRPPCWIVDCRMWLKNTSGVSWILGSARILHQCKVFSGAG